MLNFASKGQYALEGFSLSDTSTTWFDRQIGLQAQEIFTGVYVSLEGRPSMDQASWGKSIWAVGDLHYRGEYFQEVYLLYDLENDILLTKNHLNSTYFDEPIKLNQEQINSFKIGDERFVHRTFSSTLPTGFYHELFNSGSFALYAKRRMVRKLAVNEVLLIPDDSFYLVTNGEVNQVTRPSSFYKLFPGLKSQLKPVFRSLRVRKFEKASTQQLKQLARRCASIISQA